MRNTVRQYKNAITLFLVAFGGVTLGAALNNGVFASIPDSNGTINGCYRAKGGDLRVLDTATSDTCSNKEVGVSWQQQGSSGGQPIVKGLAYFNANRDFDATRSQGVTQTAPATNIDNPNGVGICLDLNFDAIIGVQTTGGAVALSHNSDPLLAEFCPANYDVYLAEYSPNSAVIFY